MSQQPGQVAIGSERLNRVEVRVLESQEHLNELDQSIAGVSDNTAKQGKAITTLMEQQKSTSAMLDAVVRAVKRLDRSRSRPRVVTVSTPSAPHSGCKQSAGKSKCPQGELPAERHEQPASGTVWSEEAGCCDDPEPQGNLQVAGIGAHDRTRLPAQSALANWVDDEPMEGVETGEAAALWSSGGMQSWGWDGDPVDQQVPTAGLDGLRCGSASSSCASDGRLQQRPSGRPRTSSAGRCRSDQMKQHGYLQGSDHAVYGRGDAAGACRSRSVGCPGGGAPRPSAEMAHCVKGVLARIEEALTKLDGSPRASHDSGDLAAGRAPPASWAFAGGDGTARGKSAGRAGVRSRDATAWRPDSGCHNSYTT